VLTNQHKRLTLKLEQTSDRLYKLEKPEREKIEKLRTLKETRMEMFGTKLQIHGFAEFKYILP
jgi:hypothetical protein